MTVVAALSVVTNLAAGIEGAYYTSKVGPSGDDFTGLLALAAVLVLRSRRSAVPSVATQDALR